MTPDGFRELICDLVRPLLPDIEVTVTDVSDSGDVTTNRFVWDVELGHGLAAKRPGAAWAGVGFGGRCEDEHPELWESRAKVMAKGLVLRYGHEHHVQMAAARKSLGAVK